MEDLPDIPTPAAGELLLRLQEGANAPRIEFEIGQPESPSTGPDVLFLSRPSTNPQSSSSKRPRYDAESEAVRVERFSFENDNSPCIIPDSTFDKLLTELKLTRTRMTSFEGKMADAFENLQEKLVKLTDMATAARHVQTQIVELLMNMDPKLNSLSGDIKAANSLAYQNQVSMQSLSATLSPGFPRTKTQDTAGHASLGRRTSTGVSPMVTVEDSSEPSKDLQVQWIKASCSERTMILMERGVPYSETSSMVDLTWELLCQKFTST